jgi:hypothetical protein
MYMIFIHVLVIFLLLVIFIQDLRTREVHVILFPALFGLLLIELNARQSLDGIWLNSVPNILYLALICSILSLYSFVRFRTFNIFHGIGLGDILLLLAICIWFEITDYVFFTSIAFLSSLLAHLGLTRLFRKYRQRNSVPLAGYVSLCMIVWFVSGFQNSH